jgi:hypothetical protein
MKLHMYSGNPILYPHSAHGWEDLAVFNPAAWYDGRDRRTGFNHSFKVVSHFRAENQALRPQPGSRPAILEETPQRCGLGRDRVSRE